MGENGWCMLVSPVGLIASNFCMRSAIWARYSRNSLMVTVGSPGSGCTCARIDTHAGFKPARTHRIGCVRESARPPSLGCSRVADVDIVCTEHEAEARCGRRQSRQVADKVGQRGKDLRLLPGKLATQKQALRRREQGIVFSVVEQACHGLLRLPASQRMPSESNEAHGCMRPRGTNTATLNRAHGRLFERTLHACVESQGSGRRCVHRHEQPSSRLLTFAGG